jgi:predicted secreted protein
MAQVLNSDAQRSIKNVKFQLELPQGMQIVTGNPEPVVSASLEGQKSQYYYWRVKALKKGTLEYKLKATCLFNNQPAISMVPNKIVIE